MSIASIGASSLNPISLTQNSAVSQISSAQNAVEEVTAAAESSLCAKDVFECGDLPSLWEDHMSIGEEEQAKLLSLLGNLQVEKSVAATDDASAGSAKKRVIAIRSQGLEAYENGTLNVAKGTSHVAVYLVGEEGKILDTFSFGPDKTGDNNNLINLFRVTYPGLTDYPMKGEVLYWEFPFEDKQDASRCQEAFEEAKNPPGGSAMYKPRNRFGRTMWRSHARCEKPR
ncbi:MAG: hypothetical protein FWD46_04010 [Cystobacterineae bacterium]|nr:hypothetical protein [Cystobacterineae bacterium]